MTPTRQAIRWLMNTFPGSTVECTIYSTTRLLEGSTMATKEDTPAAPLFDAPAGPPPPSKNLGDYNDRLVLILPLRDDTISTNFGNSDVTVADICAVLGERTAEAPYGRPVWLPETLIFWKGVREQLAGTVGKGRWIAGRLKALDRKDKAWGLIDCTPAEQEILAGVMNSDAFKAMLEQPRPERTAPADPF